MPNDDCSDFAPWERLIRMEACMENLTKRIESAADSIQESERRMERRIDGLDKKLERLSNQSVLEIDKRLAKAEGELKRIGWVVWTCLGVMVASVVGSIMKFIGKIS